ncbi:hypothetical protein G9A89_009481 [Geosiphon pyriformis]|nr:hypothetical protein G9A89_009481 [Geosiphon pyriformis]
MAAKAKNSKKQQQTVTTAMVTMNPFVVPDKIFNKISTAAASFFLDMDGNSSSISPKIGQDQLLAVLSDMIEIELTVSLPVFSAADSGAWENVNGHQKFSGWMASNLVPGATFKIKMALFVLQDAVKLFCVEFASQKSLNGATKVVISDEVFLTTLKIAWFSGVASVSSPSLSVALHNVLLGTSFDNIKTALGIYGVVTSVKLKPAGLWQYAVVNFKDIFSAAAAFSNWSVLVRKDSVRILSIVNQKKIISSRDAFKAKLVNLPFGCTAFEISDLVSQKTPECYCCYRCQDLSYLAVNCKMLSSFPPKLPSNSIGGPKNFKSSFVESKSYAKTAVFVVLPGAAAADMDLDLGGSSKTATLMLSAIPSVFNTAVESKLASFKSHLSKLSVLIKFLIEPVGALVALVTKLLFTPSAVDVLVKECVDGLAKQNKGLAAVAFVIQKRMTFCLEEESDVDDMVDNIDNDDNENKDFLVYDNTFNVIMHL